MIENIEKLKKGEISKEDILFMARELEQSVMESKCWEVVQTDNSEYKRLIQEINVETTNHRRVLDEKITETTSDKS